MTIDTARLRALAEAATPGLPWATAQMWEGVGVSVDREDAAYIAAADPPTMLALLDRLEAADQRAELAEANLSVEESKNAGYRAKNNQLAAVVEKLRGSIPLSNPELIEAGYSVPAEDLIDLLATAPADALRDHDAALIEGLAERADGESPYDAGEWLRRKREELK